MKDAENIDSAVRLYEVGYAVMLVKKNANFSGLLGFRIDVQGADGF